MISITFQMQDAIVETAFIPLVMKARESRHLNSMWLDPASSELLERLNISETTYGSSPFSAAGTILRAQYFDRITRNFILQHSGEQPVIVQIGCGLDTRFERTNANGKAEFYELDLPEIIEVRRQLLPAQGGHHYIAASMLDKDWM